MNLQWWKDKIALDVYKKRWDELNIRQQLEITAKHKNQFYELAHSKGKNKAR